MSWSKNDIDEFLLLLMVGGFSSPLTGEEED
jgi:hypothetical protein